MTKDISKLAVGNQAEVCDITMQIRNTFNKVEQCVVTRLKCQGKQSTFAQTLAKHVGNEQRLRISGNKAFF